MRRILLGVVAALLFAADQIPPPPPTRVAPVEDLIHGKTIADPYRWLEDQESAETRAWIEAQMRHTRSLLDKIPGRAALAGRIEALMRVDSLGTPRKRGNRIFFTRRKADEDDPVLLMREGKDPAEIALIDFNRLRKQGPYSGFPGGYAKSGKYVVYRVRKGGEDETAIRFFDVDARRDVPDVLPRARYGGVQFAPDEKGVYYSKGLGYDPGVYYHPLGADPQKDSKVFDRPLSRRQSASPSVSDDGKWLTISVSEGVPAERVAIYAQDLEKRGPLQPVVQGIDAQFYGFVAEDTLFLRTNWKAPNGRILAIDLRQPQQANWREIIPESASPIAGFGGAGGRLFLRYLENVQSRIKSFDVRGKYLGDVKLPGIGNASMPFGDWDEPLAYYSFESFIDPGTTYSYEVATGKQQVYFRPRVPVDTSSLEVKQVWYESKDKTRVPMFLVHKKNLPRDGKRPVYLTGYGGFNVSQLPNFSQVAVVWAESGGVFALPNLRGGGEFGEKWHQAGMFERKQNVFDDFIAAAEWLVRNNYTSSSKVGIRGGSNGGLLVGAALTQRPDLFGAVVCGYPLLDMIRYDKFKVATWWVSEYGSAEDPKLFPAILAYSPYHNVKKGGKYPAVMFVSGDADTRVDPLHARKMAALMQASSGSGRPVLLHYDTASGHSGGQAVAKRVADQVDALSFLLWQLEETRGKN